MTSAYQTLKGPGDVNPLGSTSNLGGLRISLINPPQTYPHRIAGEYQSYFPVGLASLGAVLERAGAAVQLIDSLAFDEVESTSDAVTFGLARRAVQRACDDFRPHLVGITNPFSMFIEDTVAVARLVKECLPDVPVIVGGIQASVAPSNFELLRRCPDVDVLVVGEGEQALLDLAADYDPNHGAFRDVAHVAGIIHRDAAGNPCATPRRAFLDDLDRLPFPAYHLLDMDRMFANPKYARKRLKFRGGRCIPVHTSRGCPYECSFCSVHSQVGHKYRVHSIEYVRAHIEMLRGTHRIQHVHFEDDNLTLDPRRTRALLSELARAGVTWDTPNGTRADSIDEDIAQRIAGSGATSVTIAVESGAQHVLDTIVNKRLQLTDVLEAARNLRRADVPTLAFFIVGFPGETEEDIRTTFRFARDLTLAHHTLNLLFVATPLPGTALYETCQRGRFFVAEPTGERLLFSIRLNEAPLVGTAQFSKGDLFQWASEELNVPGIATLGSSIPMFWADNDAAWRMADRVFGNSRAMRRYDWDTDLAARLRESAGRPRRPLTMFTPARRKPG